MREQLELQRFLVESLASLSHFDTFSALLALILLLDFLAFQPLWDCWFAKKAKPVWLLAILALATPFRLLKLGASIVLLVLFRHYFIDQRWTRVRRGGGAPGFMSHWALLHLVLLQMASFLDSSGRLVESALWMTRCDFAVIMLCAGVYKSCVGYLWHDGMEYGRVNPMWGYHWRFFGQKRPSGWYPQLMNRVACFVEVAGALLMLTPGLQMVGAVMISLSFIYVSLFIRLGRLAWLMALLPLLFHPGLAASVTQGVPLTLNLPAAFVEGLVGLTCLYVGLLPLVKATQYLNLFKNWRWPEPLQQLLERYANFVPIIMWRVFTPDVTNFYVRIFVIPEFGRAYPILDESTYSLQRTRSLGFKMRMLHVCESIALTSVFTVLRYFPSQPERFDGRLIDYAASLGTFDRFRFELVSIQKGNERFEYVHVDSFFVDLKLRSVERYRVQPDFDFSAPSRYSPVRESRGPGSYVRASQ